MTNLEITGVAKFCGRAVNESSKVILWILRKLEQQSEMKISEVKYLDEPPYQGGSEE
jgi:hypothetical protein